MTTEDGDVTPRAITDILLAPDTPAVLNMWMSGHLSHADAKAIQRDIMNVFKAHEAKVKTEGGQRYLFRIAMAPVVE